jgi:hypothetical protein
VAKIKIKTKDFNSKHVIGFNQTNDLTNNRFIGSITDNLINDTIDNELIKFFPAFELNRINIQLFDETGSAYNYGDFNFSNEDALLLYNRFINSFIKINFYSSDNLTDRKLVYQTIINTQLTEDQRDSNGELLDITTMPMTFKIVNPFIKRANEESNGYYLFYFKNPIDYQYPTTLYAEFSFNSALNGEEYAFVSTTPSTFNLNELYDNLFISYELSSINGISSYYINLTDREITYSNNEYTINLYRLIVQ